MDVSVVIAAWNAEATLERCVLNVLASERVEFDVWVVDDASTDSTKRIGEALAAQYPNVHFISMPVNGGPSAARNEAIKHARGEWIAIVDADDGVEPQRLSLMLERVRATGADICFDNLLRVDATGEVPVALGPLLSENASRGLHGEWRPEMYALMNRPYSSPVLLGFLKPLIRREFLKVHEIRYAPEVRVGEDYLLILECLLCGAKVTYMNAPLYQYYIYKGSLSDGPNVKSYENLIAKELNLIKRYKLDGTRTAKAIRAHILSQKLAYTTNQMFGAMRGRNYGAIVNKLLHDWRYMHVHLYRIGKATMRKLCGRVNRGY